MENIFELKTGDKIQKDWAGQLEKIYTCPSMEDDLDMKHIECVIWKTMKSGCQSCPFRIFDL